MRSLDIGPWVGLRIIAMLNLLRSYAFHRQTRLAIQPCTQLGSIGPEGGATLHFSIPLQKNRRPGRTRGQARLLHNFVKHHLQR